MHNLVEKYKGIHPGLIFERELKKRNLKKGPFAISIQEYPQVINEITKGRRGLSAVLSLKIDRALDLEEGTMFILQAYYDLKKAKDKFTDDARPDLSKLRKALFWDTDINRIDWQKQSNAVIQRVFERGNDEEKKEIIGFYGDRKVKAALKTENIATKEFPVMQHARIR
jgi:plasmid maintenance system antidote protein VapI